MKNLPKWRSRRTGCRVSDAYARRYPDRVRNIALTNELARIAYEYIRETYEKGHFLSDIFMPQPTACFYPRLFSFAYEGPAVAGSVDSEGGLASGYETGYYARDIEKSSGDAENIPERGPQTMREEL